MFLKTLRIPVSEECILTKCGQSSQNIRTFRLNIVTLNAIQRNYNGNPRLLLCLAFKVTIHRHQINYLHTTAADSSNIYLELMADAYKEYYNTSENRNITSTSMSPTVLDKIVKIKNMVELPFESYFQRSLQQALMLLTVSA